MPKSQKKRRFHRQLTLGEEAAEFDGFLHDAFYESWLYHAIQSRNDAKCFIIGRTGSGKSACFRHLTEEQAEHTITITPEDLSLTYITEVQAVKHLSELGVHLDPFFIALWKHVLLIEIIKHRYRIGTPDAKQRFLDLLREKITRDKTKQEALAYLDEYEGKFWNETYERVREITHKLENQVKAEIGGKLPVGPTNLSGTLGGTNTKMQEERAELVNRFQRIVNETQLPRLNKMISVLDEDILDSPQHFTYVLIDDLDRDWADEKITNDLIRCLFRAVYDLKRVGNLKVVVALRTNIFEALDFGRTGGQQEKFRALTYRINWTKDELRELLDTRAAVAAERNQLNDVERVKDLLPRSNTTMGDPLNYILARTLMRPRDAIAFLNECLAYANNKDRITWRSIHAAELNYSTNRLLALRDEWSSTFPGIDNVFEVFKGAPYVMGATETLKRLDNCALLTADPDFPGTTWMTEVAEPIWSASASDDWVEVYQPLIKLLHNIGFVGILSSEDGTDDAAIFSHDDPSFPDHVSNLRGVNAFIVHPSFHPALDIGNSGNRSRER